MIFNLSVGSRTFDLNRLIPIFNLQHNGNIFIELRLLTLVTLNIKNMAESPRVFASGSKSYQD